LAYFLAIDAGGTKTDYALADEHRTLARVRTGTIKRMRTDADRAMEHLEQALAELTAQTGVGMEAVSRTCVGASGAGVALVADWLRESIPERVGGEFSLVGDVEIALDAAFEGGPGVLALAGTGSNVAGRTAAGELIGAGGWGPTLGDQGSGYAIGLQGLRSMCGAMDEGLATPFLDAVLGFWRLESLEALVEYANRQPAPDFSRLSGLVLQCAEAGDPVSQDVLRMQGEGLGRQVLVAMRKVGAGLSRPPALAFAGSILENYTPVREALVGVVRREFPAVEVAAGVVDPIDGALWRARTGFLFSEMR
jgi:N-acetylglucosamine kinase-like BadF-type ATPase